MTSNAHIMDLKAALKDGGIVILACLVFFFTLVVPVPHALALNAHHGFVVPLIFFMLCSFFLSRDGSLGLFLSLASTLLLFALPLPALWTTGMSDEAMIGGLLPFSDAAGYYLDANRLLDGGVFSEFTTRRPLFAGLLAVILKLSNGNLKLTLAVLALMTALAVFLAASLVRKSIGAAPAALFLFICFLFYRRFIGTTLTEHLGMTFGALGFALLWLGAERKRLPDACLGIFILTLALNARAGAFFVLPLLIVWMALYFSKDTLPWYTIALLAGACVLSGFLANHALIRAIGDPRGGAFSNFSFTVYGLVFGGDWTLAIKNPPPEAAGLAGKALTDKLYQLTLHAVMNDPFLLIAGMLRAWKEFLLKGFAFSFVIPNLDIDGIKAWYAGRQFLAYSRLLPYTVILSLIALLHALWFAGTYWSFRARKKEGGILIAFLIGLFLSLPFVPPWDSQNGRVYAATLPFMAMLPCCGLGAVFPALGRKRARGQEALAGDRQRAFSGPAMLYASSIILSLACIAGPMLVRFAGAGAPVAGIPCPAGTEQVTVNVHPGSYLTLVDGATAAPGVSLRDFRDHMVIFTGLYPEAARELRTLIPNQRLFLSDKGYVVLDARHALDPLPRMRLCGVKKQVEYLAVYYIQ